MRSEGEANVSRNFRDTLLPTRGFNRLRYRKTLLEVKSISVAVPAVRRGYIAETGPERTQRLHHMHHHGILGDA